MTELMPSTQRLLRRAWQRSLLRGAVALACVLGTLVSQPLALAVGPEDSGGFDSYEIRVIRPRYFTKSGRLELGGQLSVVMNQTFIYTYLATGILDYHFTEAWALELNGAYGFSIDKEDKRLLESEFKIKTTILRTQYLFEGGVLWTPIYGKYQLSTGKVIYFDTFLSAGAGMTGIQYTFDHCSGENLTTEPPAPGTKSYPTFMVGIGQRFFASRTLALRWDVRDHIFVYQEADGSCDPGAAEGGASKSHQNVTMQLGASHFF